MAYTIFLKRLLIFSIFSYVLFTGTTLYLYNSGREAFWIKNCYDKKELYGNKIKGKKIIVASGSNSLFGLNTLEVEQYSGIPTVNMAVHAGLGTKYILHKVKSIMNKGDIVIMPMEYSNFYKEKEGIGTNTQYYLTYDKRFFLNLDLISQVEILASLTPLDLVKSIINNIIILKERPIGKGYTSSTLNKNGDETYKDGHKQNRFKNIKPFALPDNHSFENYGYKEIDKFIKEANKMNITTYITFPNMVDFPIYHTEEYVSFFNKLLSYFQSKNYNILGYPLNFVYPENLFYDTSKHLNTEGAKLRTKEFIELLKKENIFQKLTKN